jgi:hypothetical protein
MTLDEFQRLADTWGGNIARWPEAARAEAELLAKQTEAAAILAAARRLDRLMSGAAPQVTDRRTADAIGAVVARLASEPAPARWSLSRLRVWLMPAAGFACAAMVGAYVGLAYPLHGLRSEGVAQSLIVMILDNDSLSSGWMLQ